MIRKRLGVGTIALLSVAALLPACGVGGTSAEGAGRQLVLLSFLQDSVDNSALNTRLRFDFSEDVEPGSVSDASIQIREGPFFGHDVSGTFLVHGSTVFFEPALAGRCDHADSGLKPNTRYRVQVIGDPEEFALRSIAGKYLSSTETLEFRTRAESDPNLYEDQNPGAAPTVIGSAITPASGEQAVTVTAGNRVVIPVTENLDPCTVNDKTVLFYMYESGDPNVNATAPNGNKSGFSDDGTSAGDTGDQTADHHTWGAAGTVTLPSPQKILSTIRLVQGFHGTRIEVVPNSGQFPENALLVVRLTFGISDYGGQAFAPLEMSFTTQNLPEQASTYVVENEGETPWNDNLSSAEVNTARSPGRVQGFMLFAGDGDNGGDQLTPSFPDGSVCDNRPNAGSSDDFDPATNVLLDTGSTPIACTNSVDGSTAAVWEFSTFRIRDGVTVRIVGANPAIILVLGTVQIDLGGRLSARADTGGDGQRGWDWASGSTATKLGGRGVAGGGHGGDTIQHNTGDYGKDGTSPYGSPSGQAVLGGVGAGRGGVGHDSTYPGPDSGDAQGGGGGGHGDIGATSTNVTGPLSTPKSTARGDGGAAIGTDRMLLPSAGGGGGAGGNDQWTGSYTTYGTGAGSGAAGGGFVDLTSSADIAIYGTIDVSGCRGGDSGNPYTGTNTSSGGGGGGGAGGGIRLMTPNDIILSASAVLTAAGGLGGKAPTSVQGVNDGGTGSNGRIVLEDGDSVIEGLGGASIVPGDGDEGFYRGSFDASRFKGGGLTPQAVSDLFAVGGFNPTYQTPVQTYGGQTDFIAGTPVGTTLGTGKIAILIEAQAYEMLQNGEPDLAGGGTGWYTVGHFLDSGVDNLPTWRATQPVMGVPSDNAGFGIANLNGREFIQLRITIFLSSNVTPFDPGPYLDRWELRFTQNQ